MKILLIVVNFPLLSSQSIDSKRSKFAKYSGQRSYPLQPVSLKTLSSEVAEFQKLKRMSKSRLDPASWEAFSPATANGKNCFRWFYFNWGCQGAAVVRLALAYGLAPKREVEFLSSDRGGCAGTAERRSSGKFIHATVKRSRSPMQSLATTDGITMTKLPRARASEQREYH